MKSLFVLAIGAMAAVALEIVGFCRADVKLFGPVHA